MDWVDVNRRQISYKGWEFEENWCPNDHPVDERYVVGNFVWNNYSLLQELSGWFENKATSMIVCSIKILESNNFCWNVLSWIPKTSWLHRGFSKVSPKLQNSESLNKSSKNSTILSPGFFNTFRPKPDLHSGCRFWQSKLSLRFPQGQLLILLAIKVSIKFVCWLFKYHLQNFQLKKKKKKKFKWQYKTEVSKYKTI